MGQPQSTLVTELSSRFQPEVLSTPIHPGWPLTAGGSAAAGRHQSTLPPIWIPLVLLLTASVIARVFDLDPIWQRGLWSPDDGWILADSAWVRFLYRFGTWPAIGVAVLGAVAWTGSHWISKWRVLRQSGLFVALLLAVGPGLVINAIFKEHFPRPRPVETAGFGGQKTFQPLGQPGANGAGKSFPSGHASMGFYWLGLFSYCWHRRRGAAWAFCALGLVHGSMMGLARMAQGGHWFTDVIWAAGFVYLSGWAISFILTGPKFTADGEPTAKCKSLSENSVGVLL